LLGSLDLLLAGLPVTRLIGAKWLGLLLLVSPPDFAGSICFCGSGWLLRGTSLLRCLFVPNRFNRGRRFVDFKRVKCKRTRLPLRGCFNGSDFFFLSRRFCFLIRLLFYVRL